MRPETRLPRGVDLGLSAWLLFWGSLLVVYNHAGAYAYAGLAVLLGAAGWLVLVRRTSLRGRALLVGLGWSGLLLWMAVSTLWAPDGPGLETTGRLAAQIGLMLSVPALVATRGAGAKSALSHILMATAVAGTAVLLADTLSGFGLSFAIDPMEPGSTMWRRQSDAEMHVGRGQVAWATLAPVLLGLMATRLAGWKAWAAGATFVAFLVAGAFANRLMVPLLILAFSLPAFALGWRAPKAVGRVATGLAAASILFAPLVGLLARAVPEGTLARLPLSWDHRLRMWDYALARIAESPLSGHGMDASRDMQDSFTTRIGVDIPYISLHPHNVGLQVWMELGLVGALFATIAVLVSGRAVMRVAGRSRARAAAGAGLIMGVTAASAITVGAWQYWWWGLVVLAAALITLIPEEA